MVNQPAKFNVLTIGAWHLGSVISSHVAHLGHNVWVWDQNEAVAAKWKKGEAPLFEPGLQEMLRTHWNENLFWFSDLTKAKELNWVIISYDTPINEKDEVILDEVEKGIAYALSLSLNENVNFFATSQLPVGTSRFILSQIKKHIPNWKGNLIYQPENLRLGNALQSLSNPDRAVLGFDTDDISRRTILQQQYRVLFGLEKCALDLMNLESAEMVKHAMNSFLATCVVFGNELSEICENTGANAWEVVASLKKDSRVGAKAPLFPGLGFAGGTLARDVRTLSQFESSGHFFEELYIINQRRNDWVISNLQKNLGNLNDKTILLLGVTYKPFTSTVRRSPAVEIGSLLRLKGAQCLALDPMADLSELHPIERKNIPFTLLTSLESAPQLDAVVLLTEWPEFKEIDWNTTAQLMKVPYILDTKNFLSTLSNNTQWKRTIPGVNLEGAK